jgi:hypothetical protein
MEIAVLWIALAIAVAIWAAHRGRGAVSWLLISLLLSPLIGFAFVAALPDRSVDGRPTPLTHVKCPTCAELVRKEARQCKHCGQRLTPAAD